MASACALTRTGAVPGKLPARPREGLRLRLGGNKPPDCRRSHRGLRQSQHRLLTQRQVALVSLAAVGGLAVRASRPPRACSHTFAVTARSAAVGGAPQLFPVAGGHAQLEVLGGSPLADAPDRQVALLLVHGSYHAAWCFEAHFLDHFRSQGYVTYAISLRGQGAGTVKGEHPSVAGTLEEHAEDVAAFVEHVKADSGLPVIVLGHSFGGLIVQRAITDLVQRGSPSVAGMVLLASVPPSGNGSLIWRYVLRSPLLAVQITWGFVARAFERDAELCKKLFFDAEMPLADVQGYMRQMKEGCPEGTRLLDLRELQRSLPVPPAAPGKLPVLVLGGDKDVIVDAEALRETAEAQGVAQVVLPGVAHDAMLGPRWRDTAAAISTWMTENF